MITAAASTSSTSAATDQAVHSQQPKQSQGQKQSQNEKENTVTVYETDESSRMQNIEPMEVEADGDQTGARRQEAKAPIPVYFWGGIPPIVYGDLGGVDRWIWLITANLLASAAVCPFVGALSDLMGRRYVALLGCGLVVVGQLVCAFAHNMNSFIAGMAVSGVGAGINELTALAGTAEIAPTSQRGKYIGFLILTILPFCPAVLWANLIATNAGWRFVGVLTAVYSFAGLLVLAVFYHPPPRANSAGFHSWRSEILPRIDVVGGVLSIGGIVLLVAGLLWGGYQYAWSSAHVLALLIIGVALLVAFAFWQSRFAPYPMVPRRLVGPHHEGATGPPPRTRTMWLALVITFVSGANFFSVLMLWPSQAYNMYGHDPVGVGLRGLPFALSVLIGCIISLAILTRWRGGNRWLLFGASVVMTAGCGSLAAATLDNLAAVYVILVLAGLGVGGIVVPASLVAMVICPEDLIATATAITLAVRVVGGAVGYCVYYNVFLHELVPRLESELIGTVLQGVQSAAAASPTGSTGVTNVTALISQVIMLTATSQTEVIAGLEGIGGPDSALYHSIITAGQQAYAGAYPFVYYISIGFGVISMIASLFMDDIGMYMDDHISVVI
ncbi:hypothetical protein HMPREF1624_04733 [Sporothrix schenckii ATCC 58251]|uniref:Major facilitator superfamily (MFS) profile domain-containing protein n=1 Tax=Sporothrix schenckii (strain ATCC 58251 / de Perez 2211183) TaxID=1391915 RepID=U7PX82_SPOS1|nr:hypothetical protein HMPREF1624_04733 [Sporothrix schenckii ATCC 58251]